MRRKLTVNPSKGGAPNPALGYPSSSVVAKKDEIVKLSDRVELLSGHCKQALTQAEGVLAMVTQHVDQVGVVMEDLVKARATVEGVMGKEETHTEKGWEDIRKVRWEEWEEEWREVYGEVEGGCMGRSGGRVYGGEWREVE